MGDRAGLGQLAGARASRPVRKEPMSSYLSLDQHLDDLAAGLEALAEQGAEVEQWGQKLATCLDGGRLLVAGNGGSAAEAQHLTAELVGRFEGERRPLSAIVLHGDTSTVTAGAHETGAAGGFSREGVGGRGPRRAAVAALAPGCGPP